MVADVGPEVGSTVGSDVGSPEGSRVGLAVGSAGVTAIQDSERVSNKQRLGGNDINVLEENRHGQVQLGNLCTQQALNSTNTGLNQQSRCCTDTS